MSFFEKLSTLMSSPSTFFENLDESIYQTLFFYFSISAIGIVFGALTRTVFYAGNEATLFTTQEALRLVVLLVGIPIIHFIISFLGAVGLKRTYQAYTYGAVPLFVIGWIPYAEIIAIFYSIIVTIKGIEKRHNFSNRRAIGAYLLPYGVGLFFYITVIIVWGLAIRFTV